MPCHQESGFKVWGSRGLSGREKDAELTLAPFASHEALTALTP